MSPFLLSDLLYFAGVSLLGCALGFIAFVICDLRAQDRDKAAREASRIDRRAGA